MATLFQGCEVSPGDAFSATRFGVAGIAPVEHQKTHYLRRVFMNGNSTANNKKVRTADGQHRHQTDDLGPKGGVAKALVAHHWQERWSSVPAGRAPSIRPGLRL